VASTSPQSPRRAAQNRQSPGCAPFRDELVVNTRSWERSREMSTGNRSVVDCCIGTISPPALEPGRSGRPLRSRAWRHPSLPPTFPRHPEVTCCELITLGGGNAGRQNKTQARPRPPARTHRCPATATDVRPCLPSRWAALKPVTSDGVAPVMPGVKRRFESLPSMWPRGLNRYRASGASGRFAARPRSGRESSRSFSKAFLDNLLQLERQGGVQTGGPYGGLVQDGPKNRRLRCCRGRASAPWPFRRGPRHS